MNIPDEAVEAAAKAVYGGDHLDGSPQRDAWLRDFRIALEAAAPHMLKDMRPMDLYEIEMRDNPERMKAARARMRAEAREVRATEKELWAEQTRLDKEAAWDEGFLDGRRQDAEGEDGPRFTNPYRSES